MKLKTALELLGSDGNELLDGILCTEGQDRDECTVCAKELKALELVARRAQEEAYEMAAKALIGAVNDDGEMFLDTAQAIIRALPTEPGHE